MKNKIKTVIATSAIIFSQTSNALITESQDCELIQWNQNKSYVVRSSLEAGTILHFPISIQFASLTNTKLWEAVKDLNHLKVRPMKTTANITTITAVDENNKSYTVTFIKSRLKKADAPCIFIQDNQTMGNVGAFPHVPYSENSSHNSQSINNVSGFKKQNVTLKQEINELKSTRKGDIDRAVKAELSKVHAKEYSWDSEYISEVYDNGRFTRIKISPDQSVRSIIAFNYMSKGFLGMFKDKQEEIVDFDFISPVNTYEISGIYDGFIIKYGDSETEIIREK
jgi:hypothetical protein